MATRDERNALYVQMYDAFIVTHQHIDIEYPQTWTPADEAEWAALYRAFEATYPSDVE